MAAPKMVKERNSYKLVVSPTPSFEIAVPMTKQEMITLAHQLKDTLEELKNVDIPKE